MKKNVKIGKEKKVEVQEIGVGEENAPPQPEKMKAINLQRYKGLGEMNPEQLWDTTMNPETRRMYQVKIEDAEVASDIFETLMGNEVGPRKKYIITHSRLVKNLDI